MCTRLIPDRRDRIATILVAPFLSCSARLPVYVLLVGILFPGQPLFAGCAFVGCYLLGAVAAVGSAGLVRLALLPGASMPMVLELPPYRLPSLKEAVRVAAERGLSFLSKAGTVILLICILLWWLSSYPVTAESSKVTDLRTSVQMQTDPELVVEMTAEAESLALRESAAGSYAGQMGKLMEPVLAPVGADWQLSVAVMASFAAREVFVSSLNVLLGVSEGEDERTTMERVMSTKRDDGSPLLPIPSAAGLLVFYVLAMQCLPTLAVTRREAGGVRWAVLQFVWMTVLAWVLGALTRTILLALGVG
jgi:ferrous iron transport protein B